MSNGETDRSLQRPLGFIEVFCIASGAMISSGIFILPGLAYSQAGPAVVISYVLAGCLALIGILSVAELSTAMPKAGGDYYFIARSLGPLVGTVSGLLSWFALSLKTAFAVFGIAEVAYLLTGTPVLLSCAVLCGVFVLLNVRGVEGAAKFEVWLVLGLLAIMACFFVAGGWRISPSRFRPFQPHGTNAVLATAGFVFVSFGGLLNVASISEEIRDPRRTIPRGFIASVVAITVVYACTILVTVGVLEADALSASLTPIADAARAVAGLPGYILITIAALLAFITTANAGIMAASRYPLALSRDGLIPPVVSRVSPRTGSPSTAIVLTGCIIFLSLLLKLELLVKAASTVVLTSYVLSTLAVVILRQSRLQGYRPSFRVPLYPWLPLSAMVCFVFLIVDMGLATIEISLGLVAFGVLVYVFYGRKRSESEYALLYLLERVIDRRLTSSALETELREIVHERDDVVYDGFDEAVLNAPVLDFPSAVDCDALFESAGSELAGPLGLPASQIAAGLRAREAEMTTAVTEFAAVPHMVVEGDGVFSVLVARCRSGIHFHAESTAVKAVFVIVGSADRRMEHLKTLAAIAQILQEPEFAERWMAARDETQLRESLLLSARPRAERITPRQ